MVDVRRSYGRWLKRRLLWLAPPLFFSCLVCVHLAHAPGLPYWVRIPSLGVTGVVGILIVGMVAQTLRVAWEQSEGKRDRAQLLRKELRPHPGIALTSLMLLLVLLGVPLLFHEPPPVTIPSVHRPLGRAALPKPAVEPAPTFIPEPPPTVVSVPAPEPAPVPQIVPEIARRPDPPFLWAEVDPLPRALVQDEPENAADRHGMKHRPGPADSVFPATADGSPLFDRAGLPSESDDGSWIPSEQQVEVMLVTRSGPWRGAALEIGYDFPFGRNHSFRLAYGIAMLNDEADSDGIEPSFSWHRGTMEYVLRLAGYTRRSTFDLALRLGMTADRLSTHEAGVRFNSEFRPSAWFGFESGIWEDSGVGLILQAGHSPAMELTRGSSRVTDLRVNVRIDLGERSSLEFGYRMISALFRDKVGTPKDDYVEKMDRTFMGPIASMILRF